MSRSPSCRSGSAAAGRCGSPASSATAPPTSRARSALQTCGRVPRRRWSTAATGTCCSRSGCRRGTACAVAWTVAAWYGVRFGGAESYYQSGRDPDWERSSVGLVLLAHTMEQAMNDGMGEYRLLRGGETYKDRFATGDPGVETVAVGRGAGRAV